MFRLDLWGEISTLSTTVPVSILIGCSIVSELLDVAISHPIDPYVALLHHWSQCGHCKRRLSVVIGWL